MAVAVPGVGGTWVLKALKAPKLKEAKAAGKIVKKTSWNAKRTLDGKRLTNVKVAKKTAKKESTKTAAKKAEKAKNKKGSTKKITNPDGRLGCQAHRDEIERIGAEIKSRGLKPITEWGFETNGGYKNRRFADVIAFDEKSQKVVEIHQVGVQTKGGLPVARERKAIADIEQYGKIGDIKVQFHAYKTLGSKK